MSAVCVAGGHGVFTRCHVKAPASGCFFISASGVVTFRSGELSHAAAHSCLVSGTARAPHALQRALSGGCRCRGEGAFRRLPPRLPRRSGVLFYSFSSGLVKHSNILSCTFAGVECTGQSQAQLASNRIHSGLRGGVLALGRSQVRMQDNSVAGNAMTGVTVRGTAQACLLRNTKCDGRGSGCYVCEDSVALLLGNTVVS